MGAGGNSMNKLIVILLDIFIPPLGIMFHKGTCEKHAWICLILTFFFWIPGIIFALWVTLAGGSI